MRKAARENPGILGTLVLASASPRRAALLMGAGFSFSVDVSTCDLVLATRIHEVHGSVLPEGTVRLDPFDTPVACHAAPTNPHAVVETYNILPPD